MRFDNRPTDRQANPDAVRFRGVKTFEHPVGVLCVDAGAAVLNGDDDRIAFLETGFYRQHAPAAVERDLAERAGAVPLDQYGSRSLACRRYPARAPARHAQWC